MLAGKTIPSFDFLSKLMELYPLVNANWLMMGRGEMFVDPHIKPRNNKLHSPDLLESKNEIIGLLNEHVKMKDDKISQLTEELREFRAAAKLLREKEDRASFRQ
jgi:hypothetical protein